MPSLGKRVVGSPQKTRAAFVSFSQNSSVASGWA